MTRSVRHYMISGVTTSSSERIGKKLWHGRFRAANRKYLHNQVTLVDEFVTMYFREGWIPVLYVCSDACNKPAPHIREVSNTWDMEKDGKIYWDMSETLYTHGDYYSRPTGVRFYTHKKFRRRNRRFIWKTDLKHMRK